MTRRRKPLRPLVSPFPSSSASPSDLVQDMLLAPRTTSQSSSPLCDTRSWL
ncbi:hypothetical protein ANCDUO_24618, partial [Ancylostoma duodenale]